MQIKAQLDAILQELTTPAARDLLFTQLENPAFIKPLLDAGAYGVPPQPTETDTGVRWHRWIPLNYLERMAPKAPQDVLDVLRTIPQDDNPWIDAAIVRIASVVKPVESGVFLKDRLIEFLGNHRFRITNGNEYGALLAHWAGGGKDAQDAAFDLAHALLVCKGDPDREKKLAKREEDPQDTDTVLEPHFQFKEHDIASILGMGIQPLIEADPMRAVPLLVEVLVGYLGEKFGPAELRSDGLREDASNIWCKRLSPSESIHDSRQTMAQTLARAALKAAEVDRDSPDRLRELVSLLEGEWLFLSRLRQYLFAKLPRLFLQEIRAQIENPRHYTNHGFGIEFVEMVRNAAEEIGPSLLPQETIDRIVSGILAGPSLEDFKRFMGDQFTPEGFVLRQKFFHASQLWPFEKLLPDEPRAYLHSLLTDPQFNISLDSYSPYNMGGVHQIEDRSPIAKEVLAEMDDDALITVLNDWVPSERSTTDWWIEISRRGLASAFREVVGEAPDRFATWTGEWDRVSRPIFVRQAIDVAVQELKAGTFARLDGWLRLCSSLLARSNPQGTSSEKLSDESATAADWAWAQRGVLDVIEACCSTKTPAPKDYAPRIFDLLGRTACAYDSRLDAPATLVKGGMDAFTEAVNTTRGQALEEVIDYAVWKAGPESERSTAFAAVPEARAILDDRFAGKPPLTGPELAILGVNFSRLRWCDRDWTMSHFGEIFPEAPDLWKCSFGALLRMTNANRDAFDDLRPQYERAVDNMLDLAEKTEPLESISQLGYHLALFLVWGKIGREGLLEKYYSMAPSVSRNEVVRSLGQTLRKTGELKPEVQERILGFVDWRIDHAEKNPDEGNRVEIQEFLGWLEADGLTPKDKLTRAKRVLQIAGLADFPGDVAVDLLPMLTQELDLVIEVFSACAEKGKGIHWFVDRKAVRQILDTGKAAPNGFTRRLASKAEAQVIETHGYSLCDLEPSAP